MQPIKFGSLFAGIGGFDLGFERAGMECAWQVEIDDYASKVLAKHWPKVHRERDIRQCGKHNLEYCDVICGGFPCQDISYAGRGAGLDGERSGLFFEAIRVVRELQPRVVVLENVAALLTRGLDRVLGTMAEIGFDCEWHCIPANAVGAPHIRDRVFVIAYANGRRQQERREQDGSAKGWKQSSQRDDSCGFCEDVADANMQHGERWSKSQQSSSESREARLELSGSGADVADSSEQGLSITEQKDIHRTGWWEKRRAVAKCSWWDAEPDVGRVANGIPKRVDRLKCLGNAVVPQVAEVVGKIVLEYFK
jgi:DNA (cytosine-5)-methyltransferase 1